MENFTVIGENICSWCQVVRTPTAATKTCSRAALASPRTATRLNDPFCPSSHHPRAKDASKTIPESSNLDRWSWPVDQADFNVGCKYDSLPADLGEFSPAADTAFAR
jgi:hypothetical protein